ncbi:MAG: hypothetical protein ACRCU6_12565, partial [Fusobacteriaceae bacterium]
KETAELNNPEKDTSPVPGSMCSTIYLLDQPIALGVLKKLLEPFAAASKEQSLTKVMQYANNMDVLAVTSLRQDKEDKERKYLQIKSLNII